MYLSKCANQDAQITYALDYEREQIKRLTLFTVRELSKEDKHKIVELVSPLTIDFKRTAFNRLIMEMRDGELFIGGSF